MRSLELQFNENSYEKLIYSLDENIIIVPQNIIQPHCVEIIMNTIKTNSLLKLLRIHVYDKNPQFVFHKTDLSLTEHVLGTIVGKRI